MKIAIVVAVGQNSEIGSKGGLLWKLPRDMKFFKEVTMGHYVLMGRKTWESIPPNYKPLDGRVNMVVTRQKDFRDEGCIVFADLETAYQHAKECGEGELMIIGGGEIYRLAMPKTDIIYLTRVHESFPEADTYFPDINSEEWEEVNRVDQPADGKHAYPFSFIKLERRG